MYQYLTNLRVRLLILILVIGVPAVGAIYYRVWEQRQLAVAEAQEQALRTARLAAADHEHLVRESRHLLALLARLPEVRTADPAACSALLADLLLDHPQYLNFGVIGLDGSLLCSGLPFAGGLNLGDRLYFQRALAARGFGVGDFQVGRITGKGSINFGYPVFNADGTIHAVVYSALDLSWLSRLAETAHLPPGSALLVIDRRGTVLARYPTDGDWIGRSLANLPVVQEILSAEAGTTVARGTDGVPGLFGFTSLGGAIGEGKVYVAVSIPPRIALERVRALTRTFLWQLLIGLVAGVAAWAGAGFFIVRPISALASAARRVSSGDVGARTGLRHDTGELGELACSFDEMAASLQRRYEQAQALARTAGTLNANLEPQSVLAVICQEALRVMAADAVSIMGPAAGTGDWRIVASRGLSDQYAAEAALPSRVVNELLVRGGSVMLRANLAASIPERADAYRREGLESALDVVMCHRDEPVGLLVLYGRAGGRRFGPEDFAPAVTFAEQAAASLTNARLYAEAQGRLEQVQALHRIDLAIIGGRDLHQTLQVVLEQVTTRLQVDAAAVWLLAADGERLALGAERGFHGAAGECQALPQRTTFIPDLGAKAVCLPPHLFRDEAFVSGLAIPLTTTSGPQGLLGIFHRERLATDGEWRQFAEALGGQAAIAIDRARLVEDLRRVNAELTASYDATLAGWSRALDLRDRETEGHSQRVGEGAVRLASELGVAAADLVHIRRGALLHDVGKLAIPDRVLLKPGPLTDDEWVIMKRHPVLAYEWLSPVAFLQPALDIPYCHHERWDGTGYPRGLKGEAIPLAARIFAVIDVWDALRSERPYRHAWPDERVLRHIRSQAGRHFDPEIVAAFLAMDISRSPARRAPSP